MIETAKLTKEEREFVTRIINRLNSGDAKGLGTELLIGVKRGLTPAVCELVTRVLHHGAPCQSLVAMEMQTDVDAKSLRARPAWELHHGIGQSLAAIGMQMDVLHRQALAQASPLASELERLQGFVHEEFLKHLELMQQMRSFDVDSSTFLRFLEDTVERFQRETGISARFVSDLDEVKMPQRVCRELPRIVKEGLVNVRKHSGASHVLVQFDRGDGHWRLIIEDDGRGFPFSGRFSQAELEADGKGPLVIMECVRSIDGELTIESIPGRSSRLEITLPRKRDWYP